MIAGRQTLLERDALVLIGTYLGGGRVTDGGQIVLVQAGLVRELLAVAPVLHLPCPAHPKLQRCGAHDTSLKKT